MNKWKKVESQADGLIDGCVKHDTAVERAAAVNAIEEAWLRLRSRVA